MENRMDLKVRKAELQDSFAICEISRDAMGYDCTVDLVSQRLASMDSKRECVFVAEINGTVIGYVHAETYRLLYCEPMVNILGIAVDSAYRRHGAGKALLAQVESWAKSMEIYTIRLNSGAARKEAHRFYETLGYCDRKEQIRFIKSLD